MDLPTVILVLRYLFTVGGGLLIAHGYMTQSGLEQGLGLIPAIAPGVYGYITHLQGKAAVITAAATGNPVQPTVTSAITSPKP
jgi:hypothetical protein